ncbi:MAG: CapA family protein, partial [Chthonomonadaceae bacterium]|nr:CapA family protein [Chthonomonadaceae bacterium]
YPFAPTRPLLRAADIAFGNLECCVAEGGSPLPDKQFTFRAHPRTARALADAGFDIVSLANNHAWDYGREALAETVRHVRAAGVAVTGAGNNRAQAHALTVLERNGLRVGFLAYLGMFPPLLSESATLPSVAMASVTSITQEVRAAARQVDFLIVSLHAGKELAKRPTARQRTLAIAAINAGADIVLGHHPHVVQPVEIYRSRIICYSLGNFVFSASGRGSGAMLDATLYPDGSIRARLRPLVLAGVQPRLTGPARAIPLFTSVDRHQR